MPTCAPDIQSNAAKRRNQMRYSSSKQREDESKVNDPERPEGLSESRLSETELTTTTPSLSTTADSNGSISDDVRLVEESNQDIVEDPAQQTHSTNSAHEMLVALRSGGFVSLLPEVIEPTWRPPALLLAGFPMGIHFTGLPRVSNPDDAQFFIASCYWFAPETYREDDDRRIMLYTSKPQSDFFLKVTYWKRKQQWEGLKNREEKCILSATGHDLKRFIIQLTCRGIAEGELVQPILNLDDTRSSGAYIFVPTVKSTGSIQ